VNQPSRSLKAERELVGIQASRRKKAMIEHQIVQDAFSPTQGLAASDACASEKAKGK